MNHNSQKIKTVLEILKDEVAGNVSGALEKMSKGYSQTWMYQTKNGDTFPHDESTDDESMEDVYHIKDRQYHIYNITESENTVIVECVEQYPDEKTGKLYRTPEILVMEFEGDKIIRGRHYCDPKISYLEISDEMLKDAYKGHEPLIVIK